MSFVPSGYVTLAAVIDGLLENECGSLLSDVRTHEGELRQFTMIVPALLRGSDMSATTLGGAT